MLRYTYREMTTFSLVLLLLGWALFLLDSVHSRWVEGRVRAQVAGQMVQQGVALGNTLNSKISLLYGLRSFVEVDPSEARLDREFEHIAASLQENAVGVRALQLVRNGKIIYMSPMEGNEAAFGHDLLNDPRPSVTETVRKAMTSRTVTINGPLELKQGGAGLVARLPIRCNDETWGLAAVVIDLPALFAEAGIISSDGSMRIAARDHNRDVFFGDAEVFTQKPEIQRIPLLDGSWEIAAAPVTGWLSLVHDQILSFRVASGVVLLLLMSLFVVSTRNKYVLHKLVARRTQELRTLNDELKQEVNARRRTEVELVTARDEAEHSARLKDAFIATMSHEIRTPLHVILGYVDLLRGPEEEIAQDKDMYIASMKTAGNRLMRTIEELLHISSLRSGTYKPKKKDIELVSTTKNIFRNYYDIAAERGLELVWRSDIVRAQLHADPYSIEQALTNLLDNAFKYTEKGAIEVAVTGNEKQCSVSVRDSGIGISEDYIQHVFDTFSQEKSGYNRPYDGIGLGLALTKRYVDLHGGNIRVESEKGRGSTFTITLPSIATVRHRIPETESCDLRPVVEAPTLTFIRGTANVA
ncbi:MAG: CHASE domain-containing protein [Bacteroidetes bacterium]|nr:CHASE domain-containing protein [Bacteroidota bacterium]